MTIDKSKGNKRFIKVTVRNKEKRNSNGEKKAKIDRAESKNILLPLLITALLVCVLGALQGSHLLLQNTLLDKDTLQLTTTADKLSAMTLRYQQVQKKVVIEQLKAAKAAKGLALAQTKFKTRLSLLFCVSLLALVLLSQYYKSKQFIYQKQLRIRLTNDLHDNVSSSLNHIKIMANHLSNDHYPSDQRQATIQQIKNSSSEVVNNMHDLLWGLDNSKESIGDLIARMRDHASNILPSSGLTYQIKTKITDEQKKIKATVKNNIYSIYKEAINNVIKHTQPEKVLISFILEKNLFTMHISNDTYRLKEVAHSSKIGLKSIQKRAEAIRGTIAIRNEEHIFSLTLNVMV